MGLLKTITRILLVTALLSITIFKISYADGGFPVRPGRLLISPSASYFFANSQWDSTGGPKKRFADNGHYKSYGITLYSEYGISRRFAAVASLPFVISNFKTNTFNSTTTGLSDLETGIRYYLANINFIYYFSLQATAITPLYGNNPNLGYGEEGAELKLAVSGTGHLFNRTTYFNASDGIRQYFGNSGPWQNRYNGTFGITLDQQYKNQVSVTASGIFSESDDRKFSPYLEANKDYSFFQLAVSYGHSFTHEMSLFATAGKFLTGFNTSAGNIFSLAFVYRLDYR